MYDGSRWKVRLKDFEGFYEAEFPAVYRACFLMTRHREAALDASQEAFKRAYVRWRRLGKQNWAGGWVMSTAVNVCKKPERTPPPISVVDSPDHASSDATRVDVSAALRSLPARQRDAVVLFYLADLPLGAIAEVMNITEGAVKAHLAKGRAKLRPLLEVRHA